MTCVSCLVSLLITIVIPLKLTYTSIQEGKQTKLWAIYWAFYSLINGIYWLMPFLSEAPFNFIFVVFLVWLYHDTFKGALVINDVISKLVESNPAISSNINMIAQKVKFLNLFESTQAEKEKTN